MFFPNFFLHTRVPSRFLHPFYISPSSRLLHFFYFFSFFVLLSGSHWFFHTPPFRLTFSFICLTFHLHFFLVLSNVSSIVDQPKSAHHPYQPRSVRIIASQKKKKEKKKVITLNSLVVWPEITLPTCGLKSVTLPT